jgi:hypothetical protein
MVEFWKYKNIYDWLFDCNKIEELIYQVSFQIFFNN